MQSDPVGHVSHDSANDSAMAVMSNDVRQPSAAQEYDSPTDIITGDPVESNVKGGATGAA